MRTWKMEGPPEMVDGMVMKVMTSCSLRPASLARKPPMAWIPSCELPARRMTASEILESFGEEPWAGANVDASLIKNPEYSTEKSTPSCNNMQADVAKVREEQRNVHQSGCQTTI